MPELKKHLSRTTCSPCGAICSRCPRRSVVHPGLITADDIDILDGQRSAVSLRDLYDYAPDWGHLGADLQDEITDVMRALGEQGRRTDREPARD